MISYMYLAIQKQKLFCTWDLQTKGYWEGEQQINEVQHFMPTIGIREIHLKSRID